MIKDTILWLILFQTFVLSLPVFICNNNCEIDTGTIQRTAFPEIDIGEEVNWSKRETKRKDEVESKTKNQTSKDKKNSKGNSTEDSKRKHKKSDAYAFIPLISLGCLLPLCVSEDKAKREKREREDLQVNGQVATFLEYNPIPMTNFVDDPMDIDTESFANTKGRNQSRFEKLYGDSDFDLQQQLSTVTSNYETERGCIVQFPLRTVAILRILFEESSRFTPELIASFDDDYLAFVTDLTNSVKVIEKFVDCGDFINHFDDQSNDAESSEDVASSTSSETNDPCIICSEHFKPMDAVYVLPNCCHYFHPHCCHQWLKSSMGSCPTCSKNVFPTQDRFLNTDTIIQVFERYSAVDTVEREFWSHVQVVKNEDQISSDYGTPEAIPPL